MPSANIAAYGPSRYTLWIADSDENGCPVDPKFISAAYDLAPRLFSYRQEEIGCESVTATLIQSSVNAASRAAPLVAIENPFGYLLRVFTRKVDRFLSRSQAEVPAEDEFLEDAASRQERADAVVTLLHNRILAERALSMMSPGVQELCNLHIIHGLPMDTIAEIKGEPSNRLAVRLSRGLKRVAKALSTEYRHKREL
jgi:DNA-directed RNA polymerase specialized sigma24 family protein